VTLEYWYMFPIGILIATTALALMERFEMEEASRGRMAEFGVSVPWQAFVQVRLHIYEDMLADPELLRDNQ